MRDRVRGGIPVRRSRGVSVLSSILAVTVAITSSLLGPQARAAFVPSGAETRALGIDPELRDGPALAFIYPQQAVLQPRQLLILDTSNGMSTAGFLALGEQRIFVLSSRLSTPTGNAAGIHAGGAGAVGPLRLGLSGGGYLVKDSHSDESYSAGNNSWDFRYTASAADANLRSVEALAGVGVGRGRSRLDLACETRWETADRAGVRISIGPSTSDTTVISLEGDRRPFVLYHLRAGLPIGSSSDLKVMAKWGGGRRRWDGMFQGIVLGEQLFRRETLRGWQDAWQAGAAVSFPAGRLDRVTASVSWASLKLPTYESDYQTLHHSASSRRNGALALSVEERVWRELGVVAGLGRSYTRTKSDVEYVSAPSSIRLETTVDETLGYDFNWGATWSHGPFRVAGIVYRTPQVDTPFTSLDLGYTF